MLTNISCPKADDELLPCPGGLCGAGLHLAGREPHAQPREHLGGEISPAFILPSIFMTRFACSGGFYAMAELDLCILLSISL